jgi:hypothetical protein
MLALSVGVKEAAFAQGRVFRCDGPDGTPLYQNAAGKGCRELDLQPLNTVPSPRGVPSSVKSAAPAPVATARTASFPRVEATTQRDRDSDRKRLLSDELKREQDRLAELQKEFNGGEPERRGDERNYQKYIDRVERLKQDIARAESSVASLEREISIQRD